MIDLLSALHEITETGLACIGVYVMIGLSLGLLRVLISIPYWIRDGDMQW